MRPFSLKSKRREVIGVKSVVFGRKVIWHHTVGFKKLRIRTSQEKKKFLMSTRKKKRMTENGRLHRLLKYYPRFSLCDPEKKKPSIIKGISLRLRRSQTWL